MIWPSGEIFAPLTRDDLLTIPAIETSDMAALPAQPLVSVLMITWRHEHWIEAAIAGVAAQRCPFPIELLLGEDCSPDRTLELCRRAQARHPQLIRLITADRNVGGKRNMLRLRVRARGRYLAFCEGDDYWIDPEKLAKQVAVLEADPSLSGCASMVEVHVSEAGSDRIVRRRITPNRFRPRWHMHDLLTSRSQPHTCGLVYRAGLIPLPRWFIDAVGGHKEQLLLHAGAGPIACLPDVTAVYRHHGTGMASGASRRQILPREIFRQRRMVRHLERPQADRLVANLVASMLELLGMLASRRQRWSVGRRGLRRLLAWTWRVRPRPWHACLQAALGLHCSWLYNLVYRQIVPHLQASALYTRLLAVRQRRRGEAPVHIGIPP